MAMAKGKRYSVINVACIEHMFTGGRQPLHSLHVLFLTKITDDSESLNSGCQSLAERERESMFPSKWHQAGYVHCPESQRANLLAPLMPSSSS